MMNPALHKIHQLLFLVQPYFMWQSIRRFGIEIYSFLTAPLFVKNCLGMITFLGSIFFLTFWWMKCYTNHGESMEVPNYVNMGFREASKKAKSRDFRVAISDSIYVPGKPPGEITAQNPKPGSRVKEERTLYFTVTKNNPDIVKLPGLAGSDDYEMYAKKLSRLGLKTRISARVNDPKLEPNTITDVIYRGDTITNKLAGAGTHVNMGSTVDFVVSEKVTLNVSIPDCVCQTFDAAKFLLQTANLNVGTVAKDNTVTDEERAYVYRQSPKYNPNDKIRVGEQIDIYLTQEKPKSCQ
jgi:beta-lactam-binding protein with PASTA domain